MLYKFFPRQARDIYGIRATSGTLTKEGLDKNLFLFYTLAYLKTE